MCEARRACSKAGETRCSNASQSASVRTDVRRRRKRERQMSKRVRKGASDVPLTKGEGGGVNLQACAGARVRRGRRVGQPHRSRFTKWYKATDARVCGVKRLTDMLECVV